MRVPLHTAAGAETMHGAVDVKLASVSRIVRRTSRGGRPRPSKAEGVEVETLDKGGDEPRQMLLGHVIIKNLWNEPVWGA
jgi:hypothetical protein